jgi:wobble nucleotide-excising tRNase
MIQNISISDVGTFHPTDPTVLRDLRQVNYIFGSNGTGKTTISRVIADTAFSSTCKCTWKDGRVLETFVLNRDFVERNFEQLKGVFTLGEKQKDAEENLNAARAQRDKENQHLDDLTNTLGDCDGNTGKKGELAQLESDYREKFWVPVERIKKEKKLDAALIGVLSNKDKCKQKVLDESSCNTATLKPLMDLEKRAEIIFGETPIKQSLLLVLDDSSLISHESNPILKKKVIGKEDVDIAAMITKLGNSDWIRQGLPYYEQNDLVCPFCQQATNSQFAQSLQNYFDETFENDTKAINMLISEYAADAIAIQSCFFEIIAASDKFINVEKMKSEKAALDQTISSNQFRLEGKKKEPSQIVSLDSVKATLTSIKAMIEAANTEITKHNETIDNLPKEKAILTADVWRYVLNELEVDLRQYQQNKGAIVKAIDGLNANIAKTKERLDELNRKIRELEKQTTSIQPTINAINITLEQFGFDSFKLDNAGDATHYKLIRTNGDDAMRTLSEGEKTFVVFLYFYHLLKGSFSDSGMTNDRVVVFDDPVSSLDSDILFIVSSLIREVCDICSKSFGHIKQVFVLTHNVYFHKEVTYNRKRDPVKCLKEESFWIVRKNDQYSQCTKHDCNPIKTSYELLWSDVREAERSMRGGEAVSPRIENTLRRILEHYFSILGSIDYKSVCDKFDGQDKAICNSLFSWINAGSHSALDDVHITPSDSMTKHALRVFKEIFEKSGHPAHYEMMNPSAIATMSSPPET